MNTINQISSELFHELFLVDTLSPYNQDTDKIIQLRNSVTSSDSAASPVPARPDIRNILFKSAHVIEHFQTLYKKYLYHYTPFMELKFNRNITISYYWHQFPGLVHFSFINRQENLCIIPTIDAYETSNLKASEKTISFAYKKYLPIIQTLLNKHHCTQFQFIDDKLKLVFSYFLWFEDRSSNYIPIDFIITNNSMSNSFQSYSSKSNLADMTNQNFYESLPRLCYPNAPENSLICFELYCLHSPSLSDLNIKKQLNLLMFNLSKKSRINN